jgi:hypothetical protein
MRRSTRRNSSGGASRNRIIAVVGTLAVFAGIITVTQISSAGTNKPRRQAAASGVRCSTPSPGATASSGRSTTRTWQNGRWVRNHWGDGQLSATECQQLLAGNASAVDSGVSSVDCPDVAGKLGQVPQQAKAEVDRNLELLKTQIADANRRLSSGNNVSDKNFVDNAVLRPLADKRKATINRMATAIGRVAAKPQGLDGLETCKLKAGGANQNGQNQNNQGQNGQNQNGQDQNGQGQNGQDQNGQDQNNQNQNGQNNNNGGATKINGLDVLATNCDNSKLQPHTGFQEGNRCVKTQFGEVSAADKNPSLLITDFPAQGVGVGQAFTLKVSTRNLVRDRFLGAAAGGYYLESSLLNGQGLTRGHFHTACRVLQNTNEAPDPAPKPAFFVATEDGAGGATPDTIEINVPGINEAGTVQCASWAGDGSHRIPMMERANQTPAFDAVRFEVGGNNNNGGNNNGGNNNN